MLSERPFAHACRRRQAALEIRRGPGRRGWPNSRNSLNVGLPPGEFLVNHKLWPNLFTAARIALMPAVLTATLIGSRSWFVVLVVVALLTDALDGFLARRFNAFSDLGRTLDSYADYTLLLTGTAGIALLWPEAVRRELSWVIVGLGAFFFVLSYGYARFGCALRYHTWATKVLSPCLGLSMIPLLTEYSAVPFRTLIVLYVLAAVEQVGIATVLPVYRGEVATFAHALRLRRVAARLRREGQKASDVYCQNDVQDPCANPSNAKQRRI